MSNIILCADDSKTMQTVAEITFRVSDFQYVGALSADEAMDKARAQKPALILADAIMPGKTGYELSKMVKSDPQLSGVPVIVLCGNSAAYDAAKGAEVAADGHLPKPWDSQVMLDKVAELVAKFKSSPVAKLSGGAAAPAPAPAAKKAVAPAPKPAIPRPRTAKPAAPRPLTAKPAATKASLSVSKIKPPKLGGPKPIPKVGLGKAKEGAAGARTHTIMGMPTIVPPMAKPAIPAAKPAIAAPKPAIPNPLVAKPAIPRPAQVPAKPTLPTRPQTSPSKYAPPAMKSARTKPGAPEPPKPAAKPAAPVARRAPTPPPIAKPAVPVPPRLATPPPVGNPAAPVAKQTTGFPLGRPPMIRGLPTKRPAFIAPAALKVDVRRATAGAVARVAAEAGIAADGPEVKALLALSQDVVERVVWEVVPQLAEAIIRENLETLTAKYQ